MANPLRAPTVYLSLAQLANQPGQPTPRYAIPLDRPRLYEWIPLNADDADDLKTLDANGGILGTWQEVRCPDRGADLTDANVDLAVGGNGWRVLPAATLSTNRTATLLVDGALEGDTIEITRLDQTANTYTLANDGTGGGNVFVLPASQRWWCVAYFDGTDWIPRAAGQLP
jgi:hypothetical protein